MSGLNFGVRAEGAKCAAAVVFRAAKCRETDLAWVAQLVERVLGKDEVTGSIPVPGSRFVRWCVAFASVSVGVSQEVLG